MRGTAYENKNMWMAAYTVEYTGIVFVSSVPQGKA